jgi:hypothetical protein
MKGPKDKIEQLILSHQKKQRLFKSTGKHEDLQLVEAVIAKYNVKNKGQM